MKAIHLVMMVGRVLKEANNFLYKTALIFCVVLVAADLVVVKLEVVSRSAGATVTWTEELSRWLLVWMTFIGASVVLREGGHIRVQYFISKCPERIGKLLGIIGDFGVLVFLLFFTVLAWDVAIDALRFKGDIILIPMFYPKFAMVIGGGLLSFNQAYAIIARFLPYRANHINS
jgi:TRAP-type C4-dicarboxylate transport system permease small subunit